MSDYRIEKIRRPVRVVLTNGGQLDGNVFLRPVSRYRPTPEEPLDLLNDREPFFAFELDGDILLIAKVNVARAEHPLPEEDDSNLAALGVPVEVTQVDGSTCGGSIFLEAPSGRLRLQDFLNGYSSRFLQVINARQVLLVNKDTIAHVREAD